jgi:hypothetical protein
MRGENAEFRTSVEEKLDDIRRRLEGQTESAPRTSRCTCSASSE